MQEVEMSDIAAGDECLVVDMGKVIIFPMPGLVESLGLVLVRDGEFGGDVDGWSCTVVGLCRMGDVEYAGIRLLDGRELVIRISGLAKRKMVELPPGHQERVDAVGAALVSMGLGFVKTRNNAAPYLEHGWTLGRRYFFLFVQPAARMGPGFFEVGPGLGFVQFSPEGPEADAREVVRMVMEKMEPRVAGERRLVAGYLEAFGGLRPDRECRVREELAALKRMYGRLKGAAGEVVSHYRGIHVNYTSRAMDALVADLAEAGSGLPPARQSDE